MLTRAAMLREPCPSCQILAQEPGKPLRSPDRAQELLQSQSCARELDGQQVGGVMHDELGLELLQQSPAA